MADTEETTSNYTKSDCDKLYRFIYPLGTVLTGGAGDAHLIDCANQALHTFFAQGFPDTPDEPLDEQVLLNKLNSFSQRFYEETTAQIGEAYGIEMLIAVNIRKKRTLLFRWRYNRVLWIPEARHDCIGSGDVQLHPMLRDFRFEPITETALFCGIRMMYHAKRIVAGVGGKTEVMALSHEGVTTIFGTEKTEKIERLVSNFEEFLGKFVYTSVSHISTRFAEIDANAADAFEAFPQYLQQYREQYRKIMNDAE